MKKTNTKTSVKSEKAVGQKKVIDKTVQDCLKFEEVYDDGLIKVALAAKEMGCEFLRGGAFKPRTSPYDFQGYGEKALKYLKRASEETGRYGIL